MSFRDNVERDIQNVHFNKEHFAEDVYFYKKGIEYDSTSNIPQLITVVFYPDNLEITNGESRENLIGDATLYLKLNNTDSSGNVFQINPEVEDYIVKNDIRYQIAKRPEETMGSWTCRCVSYEAKIGISNNNIKPFRTL